MATPSTVAIPWPYQLFFLYIEPTSTIVGAYYAHLRQPTYLHLTHAASAPASGTPIPLGTSIALSQLANLYLLFALNEALVLRAARGSLPVWRALLFGLLVADFGHLYSVAPLGMRVYVDPGSWNAIDWGNVGFVYLGAATRIAFLLGVGLGPAAADAGGKGKGGKGSRSRPR